VSLSCLTPYHRAKGATGPLPHQPENRPGLNFLGFDRLAHGLDL
jgi:hypothetical protein